MATRTAMLSRKPSCNRCGHGSCLASAGGVALQYLIQRRRHMSTLFIADRGGQGPTATGSSRIGGRDPCSTGCARSRTPGRHDCNCACKSRRRTPAFHPVSTGPHGHSRGRAAKRHCRCAGDGAQQESTGTSQTPPAVAARPPAHAIAWTQHLVTRGQLAELHRNLVQSNLITEDDFWATRQVCYPQTSGANLHKALKPIWQ